MVSSAMPKTDPASEKTIISTGMSSPSRYGRAVMRGGQAADAELDGARLLEDGEAAADHQQEADEQRAVEEPLDRRLEHHLRAEVHLLDLVVGPGHGHVAGALAGLHLDALVLAGGNTHDNARTRITSAITTTRVWGMTRCWRNPRFAVGIAVPVVVRSCSARHSYLVSLERALRRAARRPASASGRAR